ncbi:MAG: ABC transporter ATP-binding protein [Actinobacteria bacterium]|nr:MAG: ABC transporter ATP-binding protein [Actinomycetota bacterium]
MTINDVAPPEGAGETVIEVKNLTKRYRDTVAVDDVSFSIQKNTIYGLLGRNGAGKTTVMSILTAQNFATSGDVRVFGEHPYENARVLRRLCFVRESQRYPDDAKPIHAFATAKLFYPNWNQELADRLITDFRLPVSTRIKKLSRGQLSAVGVIIGLASRAEVTFFDEPYLGLDAVARQIFYDRLLEDYTEHPRTVILSSHLIDEVSNLIERVLVIDRGQIIMDAATDDVRNQATAIVGDAATVDAFVAGREVLHRESLGRVASVTIAGALSADERSRLTAAGLDIGPVSLQQLIVRTTQHADETDAAASDTRTTTKGGQR